MLTGLTDLSYNVKTFYIKPEVSFTIVLSPGYARFIDFYFPGEGPVICNDRVKTVVVDHPVEECALEPVKSCHQVTVPHSPQPTAHCQTSTRLFSAGDKAGAEAGAGAGVCGRPERNLRPVQDEPSQGEETHHQEVVLCSIPGVGSRLTRPRQTPF